MTLDLIRRAAGIAAIGAAVAVGYSAAATAQEVSLKGKTVSLIINSPPGGGTDTAARLGGAALVKYLPGAPQANFRNIPGGGGLKANNYFFSQVPPDGTTLISGSRTQISPAKLRGNQVKYDPSKYEFVGGDANLGTVMLVRKEAVSRLTDPKAQTVVYGDIDGMRSGVLISLWAKEYLGWNLRWVIGYAGTSAMLMSLQSGELDMAANQNAFHVVPMLKSGSFVGLAQLGILDESGKRVRREAFADIPLLDEIILPKLNEKETKIFEMMQQDFTVNKWMALPPATPKPFVETYRAAYMKAVKDPDFLKVATQQLGEDYAPLTGAQMQKIVTDLVNTSDEELEYVAKLRKKYGLPVE
jgi:tripartite-type tricarboxylate transporter receptor subunit TctC